MNQPTSFVYELATDLSIAAARLTVDAERLAGHHPHHLRDVFEDAIDMLQRQAKRAALLKFDEAGLTASMEAQRAASRGTA